MTLTNTTPVLAATDAAAPASSPASLEVADAVTTTYIGESPRTTAGLGPIEHKLAGSRYQSPLRYPGAKRSLVPVIADAIVRARQARSIPPVQLLIEPFAGGASTSLRLLSLGLVERAVLSDADPLVASFWQVAASEPAWLIERMRSEHADWIAHRGARALERWDYWRQWQPEPGMSAVEIRRNNAIKCLFLNRTTFSGILHGKAGPLGGRAQTSEHWIGCRYTPDTLADRIAFIGELYDAGRIADVWCLDWATALDIVPREFANIEVDAMLAYLDPPYIEKGPQLYNRAFGSRSLIDQRWHGSMDHEELAGALRTTVPFRWILSYDHHPQLLANPLLYSASRVDPAPSRTGIPRRNITKRAVDFTYTAATGTGRTATSEVLLSTLPASAFPVSDRLRPL